MTNTLLLYIGSVLPVIWGISHLLPTGNVVMGFGNISDDNKRIVTMEWITEGAALIFIGTVLIAVTIIDPANVISKTIYRLSFLMLNVLSVISLFTGFRINFLPFKLCPFIFTGSSILLIIGLYT